MKSLKEKQSTIFNPAGKTQGLLWSTDSNQYLICAPCLHKIGLKYNLQLSFAMVSSVRMSNADIEFNTMGILPLNAVKRITQNHIYLQENFQNSKPNLTLSNNTLHNYCRFCFVS